MRDKARRSEADAWALYDSSHDKQAGSARLEREAMNPKPIEQASTPELALALPALRRARRRAVEIAIATNTSIVQVEDGRVVRIKPTSADASPQK